MAHRTITDNGLAFDHLRNDRHIVVREQHANTLADGRGVATDGDEMPVAPRAHGDVARKAQDAIGMYLD
jgi:hypothetical protein